MGNGGEEAGGERVVYGRAGHSTAHYLFAFAGGGGGGDGDVKKSNMYYISSTTRKNPHDVFLFLAAGGVGR